MRSTGASGAGSATATLGTSPVGSASSKAPSEDTRQLTSSRFSRPAGGPVHIDADTVTIADGFPELNDKREQADYDQDAVFSRPDTLGHIALARQTVAVVGAANSDEVLQFFGLIAMQAKIQQR
jgi:hypothetical protein